jgi:hypothetical protein
LNQIERNFGKGSIMRLSPDGRADGDRPVEARRDGGARGRTLTRGPVRARWRHQANVCT